MSYSGVKHNGINCQLTYKINPITVVGLILLFSVILVIGEQRDYYIVLGISILCLGLFSIKKMIQSCLMLLSMLVLVFLMKPYLGNILVGSIYTMFLIMLKFTPIFILGRVVSSYSSSYLMAALRKVGIDGYFNIAITIFFRFIPEISLRIKEIKNGLKIRGFRVSLLRPVKSFELYFVPILYKCISVSDTLTCSIISKGIEYKGRKTSYHEMKFSKIDILILLFVILELGVSIWFNF